MKSIEQLHFGFIDAQTYLNNPSDPLSGLFRKSFYESHHLKRALDPNVFFLIGDKGTGKTAYSVYATMSPEYHANCIFFEAKDFTRFREIANDLSLSKTQYPSLWSLIFLILLAENVASRYTVPADSALTICMNAARQCKLGGKVQTISQAIEVAGAIENLLPAATAHSPDSPSIIPAGTTPAIKIDRLCEIYLDAAAELPGGVQFTMFVDGLDVRPSDVAYDAYLDVVGNMCSALWVVNARQLSKIPSRQKLVLLVRPDIFEAVPFQNRGPKLDTHAHLIDWTTELREERALKSEIFYLTDRILLAQQDETERLWPGDAWKFYFNFKVESRISNRGDDPFVLFLRHSFHKPRDIIKYISLMRDFYVSVEKGNAMHFEADIFRDRRIKKLYSEYLLEEVQNQISFYYTLAEYHQFVDFCVGYLGPRVDKRSLSFSYEQFVDAHVQFIAENAKNDVQAPAFFTASDSLLQFLFDVNVLGYYSEFTRRDGTPDVRTNYSYRQRSLANLRPKVPGGAKYVIHYGVARALFVELG